MTLRTETAHFFWHGQPLSLYERACIRSFVVNGFSVNVWSYDEIKLPHGAIARDASEILPRTDLNRYTQAGKPGNVAAFTDFFRYELLSRHDGWWFDTDVLCFHSAAQFSNFHQGLVVGFESPGVINGAVLKFNDRSLAVKLKQRADAIAKNGGDSFPWGAVGPVLITGLCNDPAWNIQPVDQSTFYPIGWREAEVVLDPSRKDEAIARCEGACVYHIWNEVIREAAIPKSLMPPAGSFLHAEFIAVAPELLDAPSLPLETLRALIRNIRPEIDPGFAHHLGKLWPSFKSAIKKRL